MANSKTEEDIIKIITEEEVFMDMKTSKSRGITNTSLTNTKAIIRTNTMAIGDSITMTKGETGVRMTEEEGEMITAMVREMTGQKMVKGDTIKEDAEVTTNRIKRVWLTHQADPHGRKVPSV